MNDPGFYEAAVFFGNDGGPGKELNEFTPGEEANFIDAVAGAFGVGQGTAPAAAEAAKEGDAN